MAGEDTAPEPGAPIPPDAVDPELLRLPAPTLRRHPGVAVAVLVLGALLLFRLRADLGYALQGGTAADLGGAAAAATAQQVNRYVTLRGMPDYRNALRFDSPGGRRNRSLVFRLLGTDSRLWVVAEDDAARSRLGDRYSGRLLRLADVAYGESLQRHAAEKVQVLRALDLDALRALPEGRLPAQLPDRSGAATALPAEQELRVGVRFPDDLRVLLSKDKFPSEGDARHEVERLGLAHGPGVETADGFGYVLRLPEGAARHQIIAQVDQRGLLYQARTETYRVRADALTKTAAGLRLPPGAPQPVRYGGAPPLLTPEPEAAGGTVLPFEHIAAVQLREPLRVPAGALVLLSGEEPAQVRQWVLPLALVILLFMGFNLWYLQAALRRP